MGIRRPTIAARQGLDGRRGGERRSKGRRRAIQLRNDVLANKTRSIHAIFNLRTQKRGWRALQNGNLTRNIAQKVDFPARALHQIWDVHLAQITLTRYNLRSTR